MSHDAESWADLAEFWAKGGEIPKDFKTSEYYDHRVTDAKQKSSDRLGSDSEK